jgi:uncharacterized protein (TIGR03067 family)
MPAVDCHPSREDLEAFALGCLHDDTHAAVEAHVNGCSSCQLVIDQVPGDRLVALLQSAAAVGDPVKGRDGTVTMMDLSADTPAVAGSQTCAWTPVEARSAPEWPAALTGHPRYEPTRLLGSGGMGTVWLAQHRVMGRPVAVKVIRPDFVARPGAAERFRRETQAAARLNHPNIVTAFDAEQAGATHLLAMEYVEGVTLADLLRQGGTLPVTGACDAIRQAALGLQHAFDRGLIHRDLKPHNLMRTADGTVKILDFGLAVLADGARGADGLTGDNIVLGTPDYIAPEQAEDSHAADVRSDIYSLGCSLYHLLTGRVPFPGESVLRKLDGHRMHQPVPIQTIRPEVPAALATIVAKMMAKKPGDRFQTPEEVAAALTPFVTGTAPIRKARGPWLAVAAALLFAGLIAAAMVFYIKTDNGTIEIHTDDENIKIIAERNGKEVHVLDPTSKQTWVVDTGKWTLRLDGNPDGLTLEMPKTFTLKRGDRQVVTVKRVKTPEATSGKSDQERILGAWRVAAAEVGGQPIPQAFIDSIQPTLTFTVDKVTGKPNGTFPKEFLEVLVTQGLLPRENVSVLEKGVEGVYHLDPAKSPRTIDIVYLGPVRKTGLGIYTLDSDTLKVCLSVNPDRVDERPTEFATRKGAMRVLVTFKRQAPDKVGEVRRFPWPGDPHIYATAFSPDGRLVAATGEVELNQVRIWNRATGGLVATIPGNNSCAFTPDGKQILVASEDKSLRLWDIATEKEVRRFVGHTDWVVDRLAISPDGKQALSGSMDATLRLWDLATGKKVACFTGHTSACAGVFSPDGKQILSFGWDDRTIRLWDAKTEKQVRLWEHKASHLWQVAFLEGRQFVSVGDDAISIWSLDGEREVKRIPVTFGRNGVAVALSADGRRAFVGEGDTVVKLLELPGGKELCRFEVQANGFARMDISADSRYACAAPSRMGHVYLWRLPDPPPPEKVGEVRRFPWPGNPHIYVTAFSPDGSLVAATGDNLTNQVRIWNRATGALVATVPGHNSCAFTLDGKQILVNSDDKSLRLWDIATQEEVRKFDGHTEWTGSIAISPDGKQALSGSGDGTVRLWELATGKQIISLEGHNRHCVGAFSRDGKQILSCAPLESTIRLWDAKTGKQLRSWEHKEANPALVAFLEGRQFVSVWKGGLRIWSLDADEEVKRIPAEFGTKNWACALSPDGRRAFVEEGDTVVKLLELPSGKEICRFEVQSNDFARMAISTDNRYACGAASGRGHVYLWRLPEPTPPEKVGDVRWLEGYADVVWSVAFSPDGKRTLTTGGLNQLCDRATGQRIRRFGAGGWFAVFSPKGDRILSGEETSQFPVLWDAASGKEIKRFSGTLGKAIYGVFSPDGSKVAVNHSEHVHVWDVETGKDLAVFSAYGGTGRGAVFTPDGKRLLVADKDSSIRVYNTETWKETASWAPHEGYVTCLALSPDGTTLLVTTTAESEQQHVFVWDVASGKQRSKLNCGPVVQAADLGMVSFLPDGRHALYTNYDGTMILWDVNAGSVVQRWKRDDKIVAVVISPDGKQALCGTWDKKAFLFRLPELPASKDKP